MPELPEVEASRKFVEDHCLGHRIIKARVADDPIVLSDVSAAALEEALTGRTIIQAHRKGKHLWFELDQRPWPSFQFGMTGYILIKNFKGVQYKRYTSNEEEEWPSRFSKVLVELANGVEMAFCDKRRFARIRLLDDVSNSSSEAMFTLKRSGNWSAVDSNSFSDASLKSFVTPPTELPISELGPDAYLEYPEEDTFVQAIQQRKGLVKSILLDQSFLAGIGNWMADEVLYQARLHPEIQAPNMTSEDCKTLYRAIKEVVHLSVKLNADYENFPKDWIFHHRWHKKPASLGGNEIKFITVGGRTSAYVPALQKRDGTGLSITRKRVTKVETITLVARQVTNEESSPGIARGKISSTKSGKNKFIYADEVIHEVEQGEWIPNGLHEMTTKESPRASKRGKKTSRSRKRTDTNDTEEHIAENKGEQRKKPTKRASSKAKREQMAVSSNNAEGQNTIIVASRRSSRILQNLKKTQTTVEAGAAA